MRDITVAIETKAREKIEEFVDQVDTEIGGFLDVEQDGRCLIVHDVIMVKQEVTGGSVDFEPGEWEAYLEKRGVPGVAMPHICAGTWHSHVNFGVEPSSIDEYKLVHKLASRGFLLTLIINKEGKWNALVDSFIGPDKGTEEDYVLVRMPKDRVRLEFWRSREVEDECCEEIIEYVTVKQPQTVKVIQQPRGLVQQARPQPQPASQGGKPRIISDTCWKFDAKTQELVEFERGTDIVVTRVANRGKGEITLFSSKGEQLMKLKNKEGAGILPRGMGELLG